MGILEKAKGKMTDKVIDKVFAMLENIDLLDQLAEGIKTIVPCKLEITVKGKKSLEVNVHGVKQGQLWISVKRIRKQKPAEKLDSTQPVDITEAKIEAEETELETSSEELSENQ